MWLSYKSLLVLSVFFLCRLWYTFKQDQRNRNFAGAGRYESNHRHPQHQRQGLAQGPIESIYAQTEQDFELIVVDNGSTDESLEQARSYCTRPNFTLIENGRNTGFSHAVNQGIAHARSEFVVLFNNDAFAEPQWLAELIRTAETDPRIFAVQSLMIRHFDRELADDAGDYVTWMGFACKTGDGRRASRYTKTKRIFSACGGASLYRKSIPGRDRRLRRKLFRLF